MAIQSPTIHFVTAPTTMAPALAAEADHRIGNNLALVAAMLRLQASEVGRRMVPLAPEEVRVMLAAAAARIESIGRLHRMLAAVSSDAAIDIGRYLQDVVTAMVTSVAAPDTVSVAFDLRPSCVLSPNKVLPLGLIVGEVVNNAIKYAHPTGLPTAISVGCGRRGGNFEIEVADDGVGLPEGFDAAHDGGLGFRLIRSLAEQISAVVAFRSADLGLRFTLSIAT